MRPGARDGLDTISVELTRVLVNSVQIVCGPFLANSYYNVTGWLYIQSSNSCESQLEAKKLYIGYSNTF